MTDEKTNPGADDPQAAHAARMEAKLDQLIVTAGRVVDLLLEYRGKNEELEHRVAFLEAHDTERPGAPNGHG
jgi:hypothetical protein